MSNQVNPQIGVISDSTLQRHMMCRLVESAGYGLAVSLPPENASEEKILEAKADVWLVDIEDEDRWGDIIVFLYEAEVPILFGEGNAPSANSLQYQRWQKNICGKLEKMVGKPLFNGAVVPTLEVIIEPEFTEPPQAAGERGEPASSIWVLGASLGGPRAVKTFLEALPPDLPVAFLIAQHIEPGFHDTLSKVWSGNTHTRFIAVEQGHQIHHGESAIAPLDQVMVFNQYAQVILLDEPWQGPYSPCINQVMKLMAERFGAQTGAILFSGMGNDGMEGAGFMRERGIEVWAQSADTCANSSMPDSARAAGHVSFSGSPEELAHQLARYLLDEDSEQLVN